MTNALIDRSRAAALLGGAGVALVAAQAVLPAMPDDTVTQVARVSTHRSATIASAAFFLLAGVLLVFAVAAMNVTTVRRARGLTRVGLVLTGIGAIWPVAGRAAFNLIMVAITDGTDHATALAAAHAIGNSGALSLLLVTLVAFALGPIVLTVGLWRAGAAPLWPALLWCVGVVVVNAGEASSRPLSTVGMVCAAAGLTWLGAAVARAGATTVVGTAQPVRA